MLRMLGTLTIVASNAASRRTDFLGSRSASPVVFLAYRWAQVHRFPYNPSHGNTTRRNKL